MTDPRRQQDDNLREARMTLQREQAALEAKAAKAAEERQWEADLRHKAAQARTERIA